MSEYLQLCKGGIAKLYKNDEEKREKYRIKKKDGVWNIIDRQTKEIFVSFDTEEAADDFFYSEHEIGTLLQNMRSSVKVESGFTFDDLKKVIKSDDFLFVFVKNNFIQKQENFLGLVFVHTCAFINKFTGDLNFAYFASKSKEAGEGIVLNPLCILYEGADKIHEYNYHYSLLDVISAFYDGINQEIKIVKNGVKDNSFVDGSGGFVDPFKFLTAKCEIDEDVTLGDIFAFVEKHEVLTDFIRFYSWCNHIDAFHKAAKIPVGKKDEFEEKLWHLEIYRHAEGSFGNYFDLVPSFHGVGEVDSQTAQHYRDNFKEPPVSSNYGIELSPMNELVDLPVVANKKIEAQGKEVNANYSLLDILDAIYWEISFFGGPEEAGNMREDLSEQVKEIKESIDSGDYKKFSSVDEMLKSFDLDDENE